MSDSPQRPPRPDDEELIRFHNGDTLDNIPVIRLPAAAPPAPQPWSRLTLACVAVLAAAVSGLAVVGILHLAASGSPHTDARPPIAPSAVASSAGSPVSSPPASSPPTSAPAPSSSASPSQSESLAVAAQPQLEQVRIIQAPATGGDPGTSYCLVYTGSESGGVKEAILLANAPAYQCTDLLQYDPEGAGSFSEQEPSCEPPSRAAVLTFAENSEWAGAVYFSCLTRHTSA